jgi:hypothetical protein
MRNVECGMRALLDGAAVRCFALGAALFCTTGASCTRSLRSPFAAWTPPAPEVLATGSSLDQVIAAVNQNAARINSYQTNNASITVPAYRHRPRSPAPRSTWAPTTSSFGSG